MQLYIEDGETYLLTLKLTNSKTCNGESEQETLLEGEGEILRVACLLSFVGVGHYALLGKFYETHVAFGGDHFDVGIVDKSHERVGFAVDSGCPSLILFYEVEAIRLGGRLICDGVAFTVAFYEIAAIIGIDNLDGSAERVLAAPEFD